MMHASSALKCLESWQLKNNDKVFALKGLLSILILSAGLLLINFLSHDSTRQAHSKQELCPLVMHYTEELEVGIYAGKYFKEEDLIETCIGVVTPQSSVLETVAESYAEAFNDSHLLLSLGFCMVYNHAPLWEDQMLKKQHNKSSKLMKFQHFKDDSFDTDCRAARDIHPGEQIFNWYGDDWFESRGQLEVSPRSHIGGEFCSVEDPLRHPNRIPGCPAGLATVKESRVFASTMIRKGQIIETARVLRIPELQIGNSGPIEEFLWRTERRKGVGANHTSFALLPLGYGAFYKSPPSPRVKPSVSYSWWQPDCPGRSRDKSDHIKDDDEGAASLGGVADAPCVWGTGINPDVVCSDRMFVSFRALRNIYRGEELTVPLRVDRFSGHRYATRNFSGRCFWA